MSKSCWAIICCLLVFNSAAVTVNVTHTVKGAGCDSDTCHVASQTYSECGHGGQNDPCMKDVCLTWVYSYAQCSTNAESSTLHCTAHPEGGAPLIVHDYFPHNACSTNSPGETQHASPPCSKAAPFRTRCDVQGCPAGGDVLQGPPKAELICYGCDC